MVRNRIHFTRMMAQLIIYATTIGIDVVADYILRSSNEQKRLFDNGFSKCDGVKKKSQHQRALAVDLYIIENGVISNDKKKYTNLHDFWSTLGGEPMIEWDAGHFEVR